MSNPFAGSSVNAINRAVLDELGQIIERLAIEQPAGVIVHSAKPAGFAVGADIKEFVEYAKQGSVLENVEHGQQVYEALARLSCPTVAAVHGACMGGGTELILACRQRIAAVAYRFIETDWRLQSLLKHGVVIEIVVPQWLFDHQ